MLANIVLFSSFSICVFSPIFKVISITYFWSRASYPSLSLCLHIHPLLKHNSFQNSTEESNTQTHTKKGRNIIWRLVKHKMELCISLVHLITFKQTKTGSSQQVVLDKENKNIHYIYSHKIGRLYYRNYYAIGLCDWFLLHQNEKKRVFIVYWSSHIIRQKSNS